MYILKLPKLYIFKLTFIVISRNRVFLVGLESKLKEEFIRYDKLFRGKVKKIKKISINT